MRVKYSYVYKNVMTDTAYFDTEDLSTGGADLRAQWVNSSDNNCSSYKADKAILWKLQALLKFEDF